MKHNESPHLKWCTHLNLLVNFINCEDCDRDLPPSCPGTKLVLPFLEIWVLDFPLFANSQLKTYVSLKLSVCLGKSAWNLFGLNLT